MYNSVLTVDLDGLARNLAALESDLTQGISLIPVLKCNAYGLGLVPVARVLCRSERVAALAVAQVGEGAALRRAGVDREILLLSGLPTAFLSQALEHRLTVTVGRPGLVPELAARAAELGCTARIQIKFETGLNRMGLRPGEETDRLIEELRAAGGTVCITGAYTHYAGAEPDQLAFMEQQEAGFARGLKQLELAGFQTPLRHITNSAASDWRICPLGNAVRLGRKLYMDDLQPVHGGALTEPFRWETWVTNVRRLDAGENVGYGLRHILDRPTTVATIAVGYGDGLLPALVEAGAPLLINGREAHYLCGCMDQTMVDVTGIDCRPDDTALLYGPGLSSQQVAAWIRDEGVTLTAALTPRVERRYVGGDK